jgi:hypothetical protein
MTVAFFSAFLALWALCSAGAIVIYRAACLLLEQGN